MLKIALHAANTITEDVGPGRTVRGTGLQDKMVMRSEQCELTPPAESVGLQHKAVDAYIFKLLYLLHLLIKTLTTHSNWLTCQLTSRSR
jgi:hypothetical protein